MSGTSGLFREYPCCIPNWTRASGTSGPTAQLRRIDKDAAFVTFRRLTGNGHGHWDPVIVLNRRRACVQRGWRWLAFRLTKCVYRVDSSTAAMLPLFLTRASLELHPHQREQLIRSHLEVAHMRFVRVPRWEEGLPAHPFLKYDEWCVALSLALDNGEEDE